jgi:hypothetical protein
VDDHIQVRLLRLLIREAFATFLGFLLAERAAEETQGDESNNGSPDALHVLGPWQHHDERNTVQEALSAEPMLDGKKHVPAESRHG